MIYKIISWLKEVKHNFNFRNKYRHMKIHSGVPHDIKNSDKIKYINKPGIALTFDDGYRVLHWYKYGLGKEKGFDDIFGYFDVKSTFNINALNSFEGGRELNQNEIDMLLEIQSNGHEIAHHGYDHRNAVEYVKESGVDRWINAEINPLFEWMRRQKHSISGDVFKRPSSFIYPYNKYSQDTNDALSGIFRIFRAGAFGDNLTGYRHSGLCPAIGIDSVNLPNISLVKYIMKFARKNDMNIVFFCHSILPEDLEWSNFGWGSESESADRFRISPLSLKHLIKEARNLDLEFYTLSEIAGIASFIDVNFESRIKKLLKISEEENGRIYIEDLVSIKELDLSDASIRNLGGLEYFINLERLNLNGNKIDDLRILSNLKHLKEVYAANNIIDMKFSPGRKAQKGNGKTV